IGSCEISDVRIAPSNSAVVYVSTSSDGVDGPLVWRSTNSRSASVTCAPITPPALAHSGYPITSIAVDPTNAAKLIVGVSGLTGGGNHILRSNDSGASWSDITGN